MSSRRDTLVDFEPLGSQDAAQGDEPDGRAFDRLVGASEPMREVFRVLERAAASDATILLHGETGTGKEASAEAVHAASRRRRGPFVVVDCSAIPPNLIESELFGHERGAFTGAVASRPGALESANGGTVFLDEIGELEAALQPKLLRALERREAKRVGSNEYRPLDVRLVAATNRDLRKEVAAGRFRSDLYFRLAVVNVRLPPLRERLADLPALVEHILRALGARPEVTGAFRSQAFLADLTRYHWPGNIRELRNHVERCLALGELGPPVPATADEAPVAPVDLDLPLKQARDLCVREFERRYLTAMLARHGDSVSAAARAAGIDRVQFYRLLWKLGISTKETPPADLARTGELKVSE